MVIKSDSKVGSTVSRRDVLRASAVVPALAITPAGNPATGAPLRQLLFPDLQGTYLDSGTIHPLPCRATMAWDRYRQTRTAGTHWDSSGAADRVKDAFATLVGASAEEIAFVQSTTAGEQLVIEALDLPAAGGAIVTDTLHFFGSFWMYQELGRQGMDIRWLRPTDGRIDPKAYEDAITEQTRLVSISLVSTYNGFEHDLGRIVEIAHARGAKVYTDIIHAAGNMPIDLHASGVDFAASATYKWLMGDFGLGFLYARKDLLPSLERPRFGYYQLSKFRSHVYPFDPPGETVADMAPRDDAQGMFAMGTHSHTVLALLEASLPLLLQLGTEAIAAHRQPLLARLHDGLRQKGYSVATSRDSRTALLTAICEGAYEKLHDRLADAKINITLSRNRFRVCPSFFNTADEIEHLLDALPPA